MRRSKTPGVSCECALPESPSTATRLSGCEGVLICRCCGTQWKWMVRWNGQEKAGAWAQVTQPRSSHRNCPIVLAKLIREGEPTCSEHYVGW